MVKATKIKDLSKKDRCLRRLRRKWFYHLRNQGILPETLYTKKQAKAHAHSTAKAVLVDIRSLSKKSSVKSSLNLIRHALVKDLAPSYKPLPFYGRLSTFSNMCTKKGGLPMIRFSNEELLAFITKTLPHLEIEALDLVTPQFYSSEQLFMFLKAMAMADAESAIAIYRAKTPFAAKKLGRKIKPWKPDIWENCRLECMIGSNMAKFSQNDSLKTELLSTGQRVLVEGSPNDKIWGVGINADKVEKGETWKGLNLLGEALSIVRSRL